MLWPRFACRLRSYQRQNFSRRMYPVCIRIRIETCTRRRVLGRDSLRTESVGVRAHQTKQVAYWAGPAMEASGRVAVPTWTGGAPAPCPRSSRRPAPLATPFASRLLPRLLAVAAPRRCRRLLPDSGGKGEGLVRWRRTRQRSGGRRRRRRRRCTWRSGAPRTRCPRCTRMPSRTRRRRSSRASAGPWCVPSDCSSLGAFPGSPSDRRPAS